MNTPHSLPDGSHQARNRSAGAHPSRLGKPDEFSPLLETVDLQKRQLEALREELEAAEQKLRDLQRSTSWKITAPVRWVGNLLQARPKTPREPASESSS